MVTIMIQYILDKLSEKLKHFQEAALTNLFLSPIWKRVYSKKKTMLSLEANNLLLEQTIFQKWGWCTVKA